MDNNKEFEVALSFAGEDRKYAQRLAELLQRNGGSVFYDEFYKAELWGKDLYQHLQEIYGDKCRYCVVFVSEAYLLKSWTKHELKQAQARAFEADREYILPIRLDDCVLPGLNATIGYVDMRTSSIEEIGRILLAKLEKPGSSLDRDVDQKKWEGDYTEYNGRNVASFWPKQVERAQHEPYYLVTRAYERIRHGEEKGSKEANSQARLSRLRGVARSVPRIRLRHGRVSRLWRSIDWLRLHSRSGDERSRDRVGGRR